MSQERRNARIAADPLQIERFYANPLFTSYQWRVNTNSLKNVMKKKTLLWFTSLLIIYNTINNIIDNSTWLNKNAF